jgi:hypothetical protein
MTSIQNFDRDIQWIAPSDGTDRSFDEFAIGAPVTVPVKLAADVQFGTIKTAPQPFSISGDSVAVRGMAFLAKNVNQCIRVRGTLIGPRDTHAMLMCSSTASLGSVNITETPVESGLHGINFDATLALVGDVTDPPSSYYTVYGQILNDANQQADGVLAFQMSWQDLSMGAPQYSSAHR